MMDRQEPRRLLELAAKAAGVEISTWSNCQPGGFVKGISGVFWNPLTSDGDALRLAVKLNMQIAVGVALAPGLDAIIDSAEDPYVATRRAIVRAAAEVGEQMENDDAEDD